MNLIAIQENLVALRRANLNTLFNNGVMIYSYINFLKR